MLSTIRQSSGIIREAFKDCDSTLSNPERLGAETRLDRIIELGKLMLNPVTVTDTKPPLDDVIGQPGYTADELLERANEESR